MSMLLMRPIAKLFQLLPRTDLPRSLEVERGLFPRHTHHDLAQLRARQMGKTTLPILILCILLIGYSPPPIDDPLPLRPDLGFLVAPGWGGLAHASASHAPPSPGALLLGADPSLDSFAPRTTSSDPDWVEARQIPLHQLQSEIAHAIAAFPSGQWSVYIENLRSGATLAIQADRAVHPASTIKLAIALDLLRWMDENPEIEMERGPFGAGRTYEQLLRAMLIPSEEDAAAILTDFLQALPDHEINSQLASWGFHATTVLPRETSARELALMLTLLQDGALLSSARTTWMLDALREPSQGDDERLGGGIPSCRIHELAHKTGTTFERGLGVVADVGLYASAELTYVIAVVGNSVDWVDFEAAKALISEISRLTYQSFSLESEPSFHLERGCFLRVCPTPLENLLYCPAGLLRQR
jgi:hypothetical protein